MGASKHLRFRCLLRAASLRLISTCTSAGALGSAELLGEAGLRNDSTVFVNLALEGGGKKRKKKTYTKPKKVKSKRNKVIRLRRECPHELCGPGVFMAMHFNRYYCGKCHLTYLIKKGDDK